MPKLAAARADLDDARTRMNRFRQAMYPTEEELDGVLVTTLCQKLDMVVHLTWSHVHPDRPGLVVCPCGTGVPIYS